MGRPTCATSQQAQPSTAGTGSRGVLAAHGPSDAVWNRHFSLAANFSKSVLVLPNLALGRRTLPGASTDRRMPKSATLGRGPGFPGGAPYTADHDQGCLPHQRGHFALKPRNHGRGRQTPVRLSWGRLEICEPFLTLRASQMSARLAGWGDRDTQAGESRSAKP